jgi:hypothetical protein
MGYPRAAMILVGCAIGLLAGCGKIGFESRTSSDAASDGVPPLIDAVPACPIDTLEIMPGSAVCIEIAQRGNAPWGEAVTTCDGLGRRLCADLEWYAGCVNQPTLMDMVGDDYEWVAEMAAGDAQKRGAADCEDMSSHAIIDPYGYRCCAAKQ